MKSKSFTSVVLLVMISIASSFASPAPGYIESNEDGNAGKTSLYEPPLFQSITVTDSPTTVSLDYISCTVDSGDIDTVVLVLQDTSGLLPPSIITVLEGITSSVDLDKFIIPGWAENTTYSVMLVTKSKKHQPISGNVAYVTTPKRYIGDYTDIPNEPTASPDEPVLYRVFNYAGQDMTNGQAITHQEAKNRFFQKTLILAPLDPKTSTIRPGSGKQEQL